MKIQWIKESIRLLCICLKASWQFCYGLYHLSRMDSHIVSIFGGKHVKKESPVIDKVYSFAGRCIQEGFAVLTGGGPGVMEAANCGARDAAKKLGIKKLRTLGISVKGIDEDYENPCAKVLKFDQFFVRKWLLIRYSCAFIVFPGGVGTTDEIYELLNLIKSENLSPRPIILIGAENWYEFVDWYKTCVDQGYIKPKYRDLFTVTDDLNEAFVLIKQACK